MSDHGPVFIEDKIRAVVAIVTNDACRRHFGSLVVARFGCLDVLCSRSVTGFAMYIRILRRCLEFYEPALLVAKRVAAYTGSVENSIFCFEGRKSMRVATLLPHI